MRRIFLYLLVFMTLVAAGQPPDNFFSRFGGPGIDVGYSVQETHQRQYVIAGSTSSFGQGSTDAFLALLDSMGNVKWLKTYGGSGSEAAKSVVVHAADSGFIFTGFANSNGSTGFDVYVVRTDQSGNIIWETRTAGSDWDFGNDLVLSPDGHVIVCGETYTDTYGKKDGLIIKLDILNGNIIWERNLGGNENDEFLKIKYTSDNFFTLIGNTKSYGDVNNDFWLFKINNGGDSILSKSLGYPNSAERCYDFIEDNYNNLVLCGSTDTSYNNIGKNISYVYKTDINGNYLTEISYTGGGYIDKLLAICKAKNLDDYFFSRSTIHPPLVVDVQPIKTTHGLIFLKATTFGGVNDDEAYKVINTSDAGFLMVGYTKSFNAESDDVFVIKLDAQLDSAKSIVGFHQEISSKRHPGIYYYAEHIFVNHTNLQYRAYNIVNSYGLTIQKGFIPESMTILLDSSLPSDMYILRIPDDPSITMKFIKE